MGAIAAGLGIANGVKGLLSGGNKTTTGQQGPDPQTQAFLDQLRRQLSGGAGQILNQPGSFFAGPLGSPDELSAPFRNQFQDQVVSGIRENFDLQRGRLGQNVNQQATLAGAFGGNRASILEAQGLNDINRNETNQIANLLSQNNATANAQGLQFGQIQNQLQNQQLQELIFRQLTAAGLLGQGVGGGGTTSSSTQPGGSALGAAGGLATALSGKGGKGGPQALTQQQAQGPLQAGFNQPGLQQFNGGPITPQPFRI